MTDQPFNPYDPVDKRIPHHVTITTQITNAAEMKREFMARASAQGLRVDCLFDGKLDAEIAIVAEAPGSNEAHLKMPLVGAAGKMLWEVLAKHGITRNMCWTTNVVKRQVSYVKGRDDVPAGEAAHWRELLRWELGSLPKLRYVLVLGAPALRALTEHSSIDALRGTVELRAFGSRTATADATGTEGEPVLSDGLTWFVYTFKPEMVMREPKFEAIFRLDIYKFVQVMKGKYKEHIVDAFINPSPQEALDYIARMRDEARGVGGKPISYDIECIAGETACIGFANNAYSGACINWRDRSTNRFNLHEEVTVRRAIAELFADPQVRLVAQNGNFDAYWLWYKDRMRVRRTWFDTLLAHHTLYSVLPHSLAFLVAQYTWHPYYKDEKDGWREKPDGDIDTFWQYNVKDCALTWAVHVPLLRELQQQKLDQFYFKHVMHLQPHLVRMTVTGVPVDVNLKDTLSDELADEVARLHAQFLAEARIATGDDNYLINPGSHQQLRRYFFTDLRLTGRGTSTDYENRQRMLHSPKTSVEAKQSIITLDKFKEEQKFYGTYASCTIDEDNRIRCEWTQFGTQTAPGRLSSKQVLWGSGMNLQNQPERAKKMYIAPPGYGFVYFDMAQIEARLVGWLAGIKKWIEQFEQARVDGKYDAHRALASEMFKMEYDLVPKGDWTEDGKPTIRYISKRCRHGLNYRMFPDRLVTTINTDLGKQLITLAQGNILWKKYHLTTPELQKWWEYEEKLARRDKMLMSPLGRRLSIMGRIDDDALESIIAFKPQSTAGDKVASVIYHAHEDANWPREAAVVINAHDALLTLCPLEKRDSVVPILRRYAESPIRITDMHGVTRDLIVPADFGYSQPGEDGIHRWSTIKKLPKAA